MSLRDAAQQALEVIGWLRLHLQRDHQCLHMDSTRSGIPAWIAKSQTALRAAMAEPQPQPEPVAWRVRRDDGQYELYFVKAMAKRAAECYIKPPQVEPLYTAPPQRQPLTIDECECAYHDLPNRPDWPNMATLWELLTAFVEGVRYAEKAHGIGGDK